MVLWRLIPLVLSAATIALGCARRDEAAKPTPPTDDEWTVIRPRPTTTVVRESSLAIKTPVTLVKQGRAPLVYIVESGDPVNVIVTDLTRQQPLASVPVVGQSIVRVEAENGIFVGKKRVLPGPLPRDHVYGISLEATTENSVRHETIEPQEPSPRTP